MQLTLPRLIMTLVVALSVPGLALAQSARVATVNGVAIPKLWVDSLVDVQQARGQKDTPELRAAIRDSLITLEVVAQEAKRKGLTKNPETAAQIEITRANILAQALRKDYFKHNPVSDDLLKAEYEKIKAKTGGKEYKARHVLVENEAEAKQIIAKLDKGEKFEELAKASKDAGSRDHGGELDWNQPGGFVKPFSDAMVKLEKGKYTEAPVQSQFGWHVIRLDDVRPAKFPDYDQVKARIEQQMQDSMFQQAVKDLRAKAKVE